MWPVKSLSHIRLSFIYVFYLHRPILVILETPTKLRPKLNSDDPHGEQQIFTILNLKVNIEG